MKYKTKVQVISRANSEQWYINFPAAIAQAMKFEKGEIVQWLIDTHKRMVMVRNEKPVSSLKKKGKMKAKKRR